MKSTWQNVLEDSEGIRRDLDLPFLLIFGQMILMEQTNAMPSTFFRKYVKMSYPSLLKSLETQKDFRRQVKDPLRLQEYNESKFARSLDVDNTLRSSSLDNRLQELLLDHLRQYFRAPWENR